MDNAIGDPRVVDAGRGASWWAGGWRIFASNAFTWIGIVLIYYVISIVLNFIPIIGSVGQALLTPVFMGGIMLGCRSIDRDGSLRVAHLFEGFQGAYFVPLMIIGAVNIAFFVVLALIGAAGAFGTFGLASLMTPGMDPMEGFARSLGAMTGTTLLMGLVILVAAAVFAMLNWFAPALVALHGATGWQAMKASFVACLRNWVPFLVYGLIALAVGMVVMGIVAVAAIALFATAFSGNNHGMALMFAAFGIFAVACAAAGLVVGPIVFGSTYSGYADMFADAEDHLPNPAYHP